MIEDIIAAAIVADGAPEAQAMGIALRVKDALVAAGVSLDLPEAYVPKQYPKWVQGRMVKSATEEAALVAKVAPVPAAPAAPSEPAGEPAKEPAAEPVAEPTKAAPAETATPPVAEPAAKTAEPATPAA